MVTAPTPAEVKKIVRRSFCAIAPSSQVFGELTEDLLVQEGRLFGRSYRLGDYMAMWLVDVGVLQFYGADGEMLQTINLLEERHPTRMAA